MKGLKRKNKGKQERRKLYLRLAWTKSAQSVRSPKGDIRIQLALGFSGREHGAYSSKDRGNLPREHLF
jgi:hypothetical protein